ncbi:hypothetical protein [Komagataeibacter xylinus]|uniref:hypothetical protein n=1 Tax=Komagataeibacter xylinus TaxID=28448 RepID=UPI0013EEE52A|nr:hypothetical protein [Komagataeibacter xylinus]
MDVGGNSYHHMEYTVNGEKKYTNVVDVDDGTRCYEKILMPGAQPQAVIIKQMQRFH